MSLRNIISKLFTRKEKEPETASKEQINTIASEQPTAPEKETDSPVTDYIQLGCPTLKEAFEQKYPKSLVILKMFEAANLCDATWENLTKVRLQRFVDYMGERLSPNSVNQYAKKLKAVLNLYSEEVSLPKGYAKVLTTRGCTSTAVFLTEEELQRLIDYTPKNERELYVRNLFVICSYIGCRHSDVLNLNESNFHGDTLQYVSVKTKILTVVPLKPIVKEYILNRPHIEIDDTTYNQIIRRICKKCKICNKVKVFKAGEEQEGEKWMFVASHSARRSFASNLYLRGVDLYTISKMLGHTSVKTTEGYIQANIRTDSEELMSYFA